MKPEKPDIYTAEFRASAVKLANESDKPITQVAQEQGMFILAENNLVGGRQLSFEPSCISRISK
jgi:transposase